MVGRFGMLARSTRFIVQVTCILFANNNKDMLACSSMDGNLSICQVSDQTIVHMLRGHEKGVTGTP